MRAKDSADLPVFGRSPTASVVVLDALSRLLIDDAAIRVFGPTRALVTYRKVDQPGAADGYGSAARGDGCGFC
jgi:hypothetical protein